jgi:monoamine oxidase
VSGRGLQRRALLATPLALVGCGRGGGGATLAWDGGWIGLSHERGHRLRHEAAIAASPQQRRCDVAIVGGGVAGLAAARALRRAGIDDFRLFELEAEPGGNSRGHTMAGMACPMGAHYLPLPGPQAYEVSDLLHELGLLRSELGRTVADERHLCHSPQERLWIDGEWVEGLLPPATPGSAREAQYRRFARRVDEMSRTLPFAIPSSRAGWAAGHAALDAQTFGQWLRAEGFDDPALRWYLDYACRDDYGADAATVSAWAGLHYFASRHGFDAPGAEAAPEREGVFTWPEGNAWLTRRLAAPLGDRLQTDALVRRIDATRHEVQLDIERGEAAAPERWTARHAIVAVPLHVAARVIVAPPPGLAEAAALVAHAPWLVANLQLRAPLTDKPGAPPSWDNVLFGAGPALGYVDAMHQSLRPMHGPTVLTAYWALGSGDAAAREAQRRALIDQPWQLWAQRVVDDLSRAHPDLPAKTVRIDLVRQGHARAVPRPGVRGSAALRGLVQAAGPARLHVAHADLASYSIFEEAFALGDGAGRAVAAAMRR